MSLQLIPNPYETDDLKDAETQNEALAAFYDEFEPTTITMGEELKDLLDCAKSVDEYLETVSLPQISEKEWAEIIRKSPGILFKIHSDLPPSDVDNMIANQRNIGNQILLAHLRYETLMDHLFYKVQGGRSPYRDNFINRHQTIFTPKKNEEGNILITEEEASLVFLKHMICTLILSSYDTRVASDTYNTDSFLHLYINFLQKLSRSEYIEVSQYLYFRYRHVIESPNMSRDDFFTLLYVDTKSGESPLLNKFFINHQTQY